MPQHIQAAKTVVLAYLEAMGGKPASGVRDALRRHVTADYSWRGVHPFNEVQGADAVACAFWEPLLSAFAPVQRRNDVFLAGENQAQEDGSIWVLSMGHLLGRFDHPWLGIPPTRKIVMLRFAEFHRVKGGQIAETAMFCDILHLMHQAGLDPLGFQTAAALVQPGPSSHDGLLYAERPAAEGTKTLALIRRMMADLGNPGKFARREDELRQHWAEDMLWWGPGGIGATYTIDRYVEQHAGPFRAHLQDRAFHGHVAFVTEGEYGGFFGWPNLSMRNSGGFLGLPPSDERSEMRVTDVYRRTGNKLAENWVFIDMLHFLKGQGLDLLAQTCRPAQTS
jgi:ketosteroid isomerase-like protein